MTLRTLCALIFITAISQTKVFGMDDVSHQTSSGGFRSKKEERKNFKSETPKIRRRGRLSRTKSESAPIGTSSLDENFSGLSLDALIAKATEPCPSANVDEEWEEAHVRNRKSSTSSSGRPSSSASKGKMTPSAPSNVTFFPDEDDLGQVVWEACKGRLDVDSIVKALMSTELSLPGRAKLIQEVTTILDKNGHDRDSITEAIIALLKDLNK